MYRVILEEQGTGIMVAMEYPNGVCAGSRVFASIEPALELAAHWLNRTVTVRESFYLRDKRAEADRVLWAQGRRERR